MKHFLVNDLFYQKQSGFRPNHSCHRALTELIDTWLSEININKLCGALFTDFAKAFDVINHDLLLRKLTLYGLSANTLILICSFLNSHLRKASLKDNQSDFKTCSRTSPVLHLYKRLTFTYPFCTMWHVSRWHDNSHLWTGCTCNNNCSPVMSLWCCWMDTS